MKYCSHCGKELLDEAVVCVQCGCAAPNLKANEENSFRKKTVKEDVPNVGLNILSLLFPLVGLIMFLVCIKDTPNKAKEMGVMALVGFLIPSFLVTLMTILS